MKFALPLEKISFHPIFSAVGKHTNFFEAFRAASQPLFDGVQRLTTSAYKPVRLGKSLLLGLSRRSGQPYPLVAEQVASQPLFIFCAWAADVFWSAIKGSYVCAAEFADAWANRYLDVFDMHAN